MSWQRHRGWGWKQHWWRHRRQIWKQHPYQCHRGDTGIERRLYQRWHWQRNRPWNWRRQWRRHLRRHKCQCHGNYIESETGSDTGIGVSFIVVGMTPTVTMVATLATASISRQQKWRLYWRRHQHWCHGHETVDGTGNDTSSDPGLNTKISKVAPKLVTNRNWWWQWHWQRQQHYWRHHFHCHSNENENNSEYGSSVPVIATTFATTLKTVPEITPATTLATI